jgi:hypothetical protein
MAEQDKNSLREPSSLEKFLTFVKEYKELATAIALLGTGIVWVVGIFATKEELHGLRDHTYGETKKLHCLMEKRYDSIEGRALTKIYSDELMKKRAELRTLDPTGTQFSGYDTKKISQLDRRQAPGGTQFSGPDPKNVVELEQTIDDYKGKLLAAEKEQSDADQAIRNRECEKKSEP